MPPAPAKCHCGTFVAMLWHCGNTVAMLWRANFGGDRAILTGSCLQAKCSFSPRNLELLPRGAGGKKPAHLHRPDTWRSVNSHIAQHCTIAQLHMHGLIRPSRSCTFDRGLHEILGLQLKCSKYKATLIAWPNQRYIHFK